MTAAGTADSSGEASEPRRRYNIGVWKVAEADRDEATALELTDPGRGFLDLIGADRPDGDDDFPVGARTTYSALLTDTEAAELSVPGRVSNLRFIELDEQHTVDTSPTVDPSASVAIPTPRTLAYLRAAFPGADSWHGRDVDVAVLDQGISPEVIAYMGWTLVARRYFGATPAAGDVLIRDAADAARFYGHGCLVGPCAVPAGGRVLDANVANADGRSSWSAFAAAVTWAVDLGCRVLNYSFSSEGGGSPSQTIADALAYAAAAGAQVYMSAGNDGANRINYPAKYSEQFANAHSSINFDETTNARASSSCYAATASGCAPGTGVTSLTTAAAVTTTNGTSFSSPHMARMNACGMTGGRFTAAQIGAALKANTRDTGQPRETQGGGAYDLRRALVALGAILPPAPRRNLIPRPSVELDVTDWFSEGTAAPTPVEQSNVGGSKVGTFHALVRATAAGIVRVYGPAMAVIAGSTYVASGFLRRNRAGAGARCYIRWYDSAGASLAFNDAPAVTSPGADLDHRAGSTGVAPAGAVSARAYLYFSDAQTGDEFRVDGFLGELGADIEPYFDGSTGTADGIPSWEGVPHASVSRLLSVAARAGAQQVPVIRSVHSATGSRETASITTTAETAVGDVLIAFHATDWDTAAELVAPTPAGASPRGTWAQRALADRGTNATHLKAWLREVTSRGAQRVTVGYADDCDVALVVIVLDGATVDPAWFDAATQATGAASRNHSAGSVSPVGTADLLITAHATSDSSSSTRTIAAYTPPAGMVSALRQGTAPVAADTTNSDEWISLGVFTEARTAAGATGARTAVSSASKPWAAVTLAIRGAAMPVPLLLESAAARTRHTAPGGHEFVATGYTYDTDPAAVHHRVPAGDLLRELEGPVAALQHRIPDTDLERTVRGPAARTQHTAFDGVLDNMTATPIRIRHTGQNGRIEFEPVTALTERRSPVTTRPRKRLRYLAQNVLDRTWRSSDVGLADDRITTRINGACEIGGRITARELRDLGIGDSDLYLHAEMDGTIRGSGMLTRADFAWGGPEIEITAHGVTKYPQGLRWTTDWTMRGETGVVGVGLDPLNVVRAIWAHVQSFPDGRIGVVLAPTTSTVRIGEPEKQQSTPAADGTTTKTGTPASTANTAPAGAANASDLGAEQSTGPYLIKWYEDTDLGKIISDLAAATPFDYREAPYWADAAKSDVVQYVELGFPRLGRDRTPDGLVFAEHENLDVAFAPVEHDDDTAGYIDVLGKGEGSSRVRGTYGVVTPGRVRRTALVEKKDCSTTAMANAFARAEWPRRQGYLSVDEVHLQVDHPNAPYGSFREGDDVPARFKVDGHGAQFLRHRVLEQTYRPKASTLVVKTQRSDTFSYGSSAAAR